MLFARGRDAAAPRALLAPHDEGARAAAAGPPCSASAARAGRAQQLRERARDLRAERGERRSDAAEQRAGGAEQRSRRGAGGAHAADREQHRVREQGAPGADEQALGAGEPAPERAGRHARQEPGEAACSSGGSVANAEQQQRRAAPEARRRGRQAATEHEPRSDDRGRAHAHERAETQAAEEQRRGRRAEDARAIPDRSRARRPDRSGRRWPAPALPAARGRATAPPCTRPQDGSRAQPGSRPADGARAQRP